MPYSLQEAVSDGSLNRITPSFPYFSKADVVVYIDNTVLPNASYSWVWDGNDIVITPNVAAGAVVLVRRVTNLAQALHDFSTGAVFNSESVDENFLQIIYLAQEFTEGAGVLDYYNDLDMHNNRIKRVGDADAPTDAVNLQTLQAYTPEFGSQGIRTITEDTTLTSSDVTCIVSAGNITLPDPTSFVRKVFTIRTKPQATTSISGHIDGVGVSVRTLYNNEFITFHSDGTTWWVTNYFTGIL